MANFLKRYLVNYFKIARTAVLSKTGNRYLDILIDSTDGCNLKCEFCPRTTDKIIRMSVSDFDLIMSKVHRKTRSLQLSCAWEYSISKNAPEIVRTLGRYSIPRTTIYTNGNILSSELATALIDSKINNYVISIGESHKETYERLKKGGSFDKVLENIGKLVELKSHRNSPLPKICANLTLVNSNIGELSGFIDLAHKIGIQEIRGRHLILIKGLDLDNEVVRDFIYANTIIKESSLKASRYRMTFSIPLYSKEYGRKLCRAPWQQLYISSNGDVSVCPRIHKYEKIGNLIEEKFEDIARSEVKSELLNQFNTRIYKNPVCKTCMANMESTTEIDQGF